MADKKTGKRRISNGVRLATILSLLALLISGVTVWAWLYEGRNVAGIGEISNPTAIHIKAGYDEDVRYLDLSGIDVDVSDHKDFVFCVKGDNVTHYRLQLAFTTNNQFEFEIYPANGPVASGGVVPGDALTTVDYHIHPSFEVQHYYVSSGTLPLAGKYLNKKSDFLAYTGSEVAAGSSANLHDRTYKTGDATTYDNVNIYAEPLYWQTTSPVLHSSYSSTFADYYILRVKWGEGAKNNKETDIIYITAKNVG